MTIHLDHSIVPSRDKVKAARQLAELLGVPWAARAMGPFSAVYVNQDTTLDFIDTDEAFPIHHYCFRVDDATFDAVLARIQAAGIAYRGTVHGEMDNQISTEFGGRSFYWTEPDGHFWELLTVSYARRRIV